jgi:peptidoglycan/LPS O-acetylase OafA/YrhL
MARSLERPDLPVLTSLRFWAAAVVVLNHLDAAKIAYLPEVVKGWCQSGYEAVSFFFVLSGFILTYVYSSPRDDGTMNVSARRFRIARFARIGPAYYLGLILMLPAFIYGFVVAGMISLDRFVLATATVPTLLQAWFPPASFSWNGPAWSLSVELFFYALFPYLLCRTNRLSRRDLVTLAFATVVASAAIRLQARPLVPINSTDWQFFFAYFPLFHLPSFLFGMAIGRIYLYGQNASPTASKLLFISGTVALALVLGYRSSAPAWLLTDAVLVPLYGVVIVGGARITGTLHAALAHPVLELLGHASYSVYILHNGIVFWWRWIAQKLFVLKLSHTAEVLLIFSIVIIGSVAAFLFFERPLRRWIAQSFGRASAVRPVRV